MQNYCSVWFVFGCLTWQTDLADITDGTAVKTQKHNITMPENQYRHAVLGQSHTTQAQCELKLKTLHTLRLRKNPCIALTLEEQQQSSSPWL